VDVGYYAPAARTTLDRVFLCACLRARLAQSPSTFPSTPSLGIGGCVPPPGCGYPKNPATSTFLELRGFCIKVQLKETGCSLDSPEFLCWCHSCTYLLGIGLAEEESSSGKRKITERLVLQACSNLPLVVTGSISYLLQLLIVLEQLQICMALNFLRGFLNQV